MAETQNENVASIEYVEPSLKIHSFSGQVSDMVVYYQVLKMEDSLLIWIGSKDDPVFEDLAVAMKTRFDNLPACTKAMGNNDVSKNMAIRLSKRLNKVVYVSFNLPENRLTLPEIELRLQQEIQSNGSVFN